ncbi:MAG: GlsB/YeaQ/YmgE family stress response membrane protein [Anaerolineaceae bacterium]
MDLIVRLIVGAVAGILADFLIKGIEVNLLVKVIVGVVGGYLGGWLFSLLNISSSGWIGNVLASLVGALILLIVLRAFRHK